VVTEGGGGKKIRIRLLSLSATYNLPKSSTARPTGVKKELALIPPLFAMAVVKFLDLL
jgi:hypothetical protein